MQNRKGLIVRFGVPILGHHSGGVLMGQDEIETVRALLSSKPRPVGWSERRQRLDEVGSVWPVAGDVMLDAVDLGGFLGEWSIVPGSDADRVML
jgi:hypothetical protein